MYVNAQSDKLIEMWRGAAELFDACHEHEVAAACRQCADDLAKLIECDEQGKHEEFEEYMRQYEERPDDKPET